MIDALSDPAFELEWTKRKLDLAIQTLEILNRDNDDLNGMLEALINQLNSYSVGDLWTQEDMVVVRDIQEQLEGME